MSSMQRSIKRNIAKKNGTFVSQKPLRDKSRVSVKEMLLQALRGMAIQKKALNKAKVEEDQN